VGDALSALPLGQLSAGALVALIVLSILRGGLVPRQQLIDKQADCDKWREAAEKWQLTATRLGMSMEKLLVYAETTNHALTDIRELAQRASDQEDHP
jgi:hypothetical protein